jgi:carbonic anhydrase
MSAVYRNAGGRVTDDAIRSLNVLQALLDSKMAIVIQHTDCGATHVTDEEIRAYAKSRNPDAASYVDNTDFLTLKPEQREELIRQDVKKLRQDKSLSGIEAYGFVLDTFTGVLKEVEV